MKRGLSDLFSDSARAEAEAARETNKKTKRAEEDALRTELDAEAAEAIRKISVNTPLDIDRAVRKLTQRGVLVIRQKDTRCFDVKDTAQQCIDWELAICERLIALGIKFQWQESGGVPQTGARRQRLMENERLSSFRFAEVSSRCVGRLDIKLPASMNKVLDDSVCSVLPVVKAVLGEDARLAYSGLISSFAGSWNQPWHGDGPHLFGNATQLPPHALNIFIPLQDVTDELGPTEFLCGSNQLSTAEALGKCLAALGEGAAPTMPGSLEARKKCSSLGHAPVRPLLRAGRDVLVYDFRTVHRGTANCSTTNTTRRVLYLLYTKPWFS